MDIQPDLEAHQVFMQQALMQAAEAFEQDEVPVGAVIVKGGRIIAATHNRCEQLRDATAHAEIMAITQAAESIDNWRLEDCTLYVTLEPCIMCAGAILQSRIPNVVFGAMDPKGGAVGSMFNLLTDERLNHRCAVVSGMMSADCGGILTEFFKRKRAMGKK